MKSHTPKGQAARARILRTAEHLFVMRGFHGTSMRDVADAAGLPLATLVYHFARKEQLYAALLTTIGDELLGGIEGADLDTFVEKLVKWTIEEPGRVKLLLRELLDNPARVRRATQLPLAPFLERATTLVRVPNPELAVLHAVGAVSYVVAAWPTVDRIVGPERSQRLHAGYEREAIAFVRRSLGMTDHGTRTPNAARSSRARAPRA